MKEEVKGSITDQETEQLRELPETVPEYPLLSFDQISRSEDSSLKAATSNSMLGLEAWYASLGRVDPPFPSGSLSVHNSSRHIVAGDSEIPV